VNILNKQQWTNDKGVVLQFGGCYCYQFHTKLLNVLLSRLGPYIDEIIGDDQCGFQCNRSTTDQIFGICQILVKMGVQ
jgi:hypothetical protein